MPYRLRPRGPRRTDPELMAIHDALNLDVLRYIALLAQTHRSPYRTRGRVRAARELRARIVATRGPFSCAT
eukprot:COSAG02_NODE_2119_length_9782_cov_4.432511_7_plen_71_part_00